MAMIGDMFPADLVERSYRSGGGELGWTREDARIAIAALEEQQQAILGGELWWQSEGRQWLSGVVPQRQGPPGVYHWETERAGGEDWPAYVRRCAQDSLRAVVQMPGPYDLPIDLGGRILYNLTWESEEEWLDPIGWNR